MRARNRFLRLLAASMIIALVLPLGATHAQGDASTQLKPIDQSGDIGGVIVEDVTDDGAAGCMTYLMTTQPHNVEITVRGPIMTPGTGFHTQHPLVQQKVSWQVFFFEVNSSSSTTFLLTSQEIVGLTGVDFGWKHFGPFPIGPKYVVAIRYRWYDLAGTSVIGTLNASPEHYGYLIKRDSGMKQYASRTACTPALKPTSSLTPGESSVGSKIALSAAYFPIGVPVKVTLDGASLATITSGSDGRVTGTVKIPDATGGTHTVSLTAGAWTTSASLLVKARIRVAPVEAQPGIPVVLNLTGFRASEAVTIKWTKGASWVTVATTTVSTKGTRNKTVTVPSWASGGTNTIRAIGSLGTDVKTNGLTVPVALPAASPVVPTPTPTVVPASSPLPTATSTPEPAPTDVATPEPVETATPVPPPVESTTPETTPEPTVEAEPTPESTVETAA